MFAAGACGDTHESYKYQFFIFRSFTVDEFFFLISAYLRSNFLSFILQVPGVWGFPVLALIDDVRRITRTPVPPDPHCLISPLGAGLCFTQ